MHVVHCLCTKQRYRAIARWRGVPLSTDIIARHLTCKVEAVLRNVPCTEGSVASAADIRKLAGEIMAFEEGPASDALDTGGPTWPYEGRRRWRFLLETTTQLPQVIQSRIDILPEPLEAMLHTFIRRQDCKDRLRQG